MSLKWSLLFKTILIPVIVLAVEKTYQSPVREVIWVNQNRTEVWEVGEQIE